MSALFGRWNRTAFFLGREDDGRAVATAPWCMTRWQGISLRIHCVMSSKVNNLSDGFGTGTRGAGSSETSERDTTRNGHPERFGRTITAAETREAPVAVVDGPSQGGGVVPSCATGRGVP